ncbi:IclR family transcriptional regulator [Saccharomonospora sp. CUA-673]|uniref:IclR family transcriptional regulator n=1 Tax=Saccharomonospora sp. CUA-673 TaxID=1904969 RepID=UPI001C9E6ABD|nr:IclR family transcriptional regulator [Saccharomonospora sp. CUA-673]
MSANADANPPRTRPVDPGHAARRSASWTIAHTADDGPRPAGSQSIQRALVLLNLVGVLARDRPEGVSLAELTRVSGRPKASVRRTLVALASEGFVEQDPDSALYRLGVQARVLGGLAEQDGGDLGALSTDSLIRLADASADTSFLTVRHGSYGVCTHRQEGPGRIRNYALAVGDRHPLGIGAGSLAILSALSDAEVEEVLASTSATRRRYPLFDDDALRHLVRRSRQAGYALNEGRVVPGSWAVGVAIHDAADRPVAAFSVASIAERLDRNRQHDLAALLAQEAATVHTALVRAQQSRRTRGRP